MLTEIGNMKGNSNATTRWATFGPYYAMFPIDFAFDIVNEFSRKGDYIIDPFAGRFSSIYAGSILGRHSVGIEINPVGWIYGKTKLDPAKKILVQEKLKTVYEERGLYESELVNQPKFFRMCFCDDVLTFLLAARDRLDWKRRKIDRTLMSILLVSLHGKLGEGLSNQMRQTKAMSPQYSIDWWKRNGYATPPEIDPLSFLNTKIEWRYRKGTPEVHTKSRALLGESTLRLNELSRESKQMNIKYSLLFTSPPYQAVVNYHYDQWLRLWLLNTPPPKGRYSGRFESKTAYRHLLDSVFEKCSRMMKRKSTVVVRTDVREFTLNATIDSLSKYFPRHTLRKSESVVQGISQTELFRNSSKKKEIDLILTR